jgi:hypothetical protein
MNKWIKVSLYVFLGLLVGLVGSLIYLAHHDITREYIRSQLVESFKNNYNCHFEGSVEQLDFFSLTCRLENISVTPLDISQGDWFISIDACSVDVSWFSLLWNRIFLIRGSCEHLVMHETFETQPQQLADFLKQLSRAPGAELIQYDTLSVVDGVLSFADRKNKFRWNCQYTANIAQDGENIQTHMHLENGYLSWAGRTVIDEVAGSLRCRVPYKADIANIYVHTDLHMTLPDLQNQSAVAVFGEFDAGKGHFVIENRSGLFAVNPVTVDCQDPSQAKVSMSMQLTPKLLTVLGVPTSLQEKIGGGCRLTAVADLYDLGDSVKAELRVDQVVYNDLVLCDDFILRLHHDGQGYTGEIVADQLVASGPISFDAQSAHADLVNKKDLVLFNGQWNIKANSAAFKIDFTQKDGLLGSYDLYATKKHHADPVHLSGSFAVDHEYASCNGQLDEQEYKFKCAYNPFVLDHCIVQEAEKTLVNFYADQAHPNRLEGTVDFNYVKKLVPHYWKPSFTQQGSFLFEGEIINGIYHASVQTSDAHIRIPQVYNVVQSFNARAEIDLYNRSLELKDLACSLYEGDISCGQARLLFDERGKLAFVHAPLIFKNVMLSGYKGIFATFSGKLHCEKREENPFLVSGFLVADRVQLKGNILSKEFQDQVIGSVDYGTSMQNSFDGELDLHIMTRDGVEVQTSFINTELRGKVDVTGSLYKPNVQGSIYLHGGSFAFPYKSLEIMQGKISCLPGPTFDPFIEVVARGKLKRYAVTMRVIGSMSDQKISFESVPHLEEAQIIGLLLVGSEDHSLSTMAPAFLMQSLQELVFGPAVSKTNLNSFFDTLLKPFKRIRFIPQFTNQTGRGGMGGIIEIDATEKLSGRIDSNFMQLEDTKFEINYAATDEITFRALKDGPSGYGGEVEMRWSFNKFGK